MKTKVLCGLTAVGASVLTLAAFPSLADQAAPAAKPAQTSTGCAASACTMTPGATAKACESYTGTVTAVNPNERMLEVKEFLFSKKFDLGDHCAYIAWNKSAGDINNLRPGEKVTVAYRDVHDVLVAERIQQDPMREAGRVVAVDPGTHTLTLHSGWTDKTFQTPENCQVVLQGGKTGSLAGLQPGNYVTVTYVLPHDQAVAREIAQTGTTFTGKLTALDLNNRIVMAKSPFETKQFRLADNCAIVLNGKPDEKISDLRPGEELTFGYNDVDGIYIVNTIDNAAASHQHETTSARTMPSYSPPYSQP